MIEPLFLHFEPQKTSARRCLTIGKGIWGTCTQHQYEEFSIVARDVFGNNRYLLFFLLLPAVSFLFTRSSVAKATEFRVFITKSREVPSTFPTTSDSSHVMLQPVNDGTILACVLLDTMVYHCVGEEDGWMRRSCLFRRVGKICCLSSR